ncbi:MAG: acetyl-CoA carboxylase carboxyl transferase subunit alpha, partial [Pirellulaceae bacterium]|nr:acetyl-CoA carboxylase carboxyl transferase subunit alpha [Pirellulaceae bacterium]
MANDEPTPGLPFEQPIYELEARIHRLRKDADAADGERAAELQEEIRQLRRELTGTIERCYASLTPWQTVQVARHKDRPHTTDYLTLVFDEFVE